MRLHWSDLSIDTRELLAGKLAGLWESPTDEAAFDSWPADKQQAMLLILVVCVPRVSGISSGEQMSTVKAV